MAHAWKACLGSYPNEGSNPSLSVSFQQLKAPDEGAFFVLKMQRLYIDCTSIVHGIFCVPTFTTFFRPNLTNDLKVWPRLFLGRLDVDGLSNLE